MSNYTEQEIAAATADERLQHFEEQIDTLLRRAVALNIEVRRRDARLETMQDRIKQLQSEVDELRMQNEKT